MSGLACFRRSRLGMALQFVAMCGLILQPVPLARSYWTDSNGDGVKEWVDDPPPEDSWWNDDGDGDGWANGFEAVYGSDPYRLDSDFDGITDRDEHDLLPLNDPWHWDSDGDGFSDYDEYYNQLQGTPLSVDYAALISSSQPFYSAYDADGDGLHNPWDSEPLGFDRDGDGILNWQDSYMDDANNGSSPPPEGPPPDSDGDGISDDSDPYPYGSYWFNGAEYGGAWVDADGDGIPDPADAFPNGSFIYNGTEYEGAWSDMDNDGVPDVADPFPSQGGSYWYEGVEYGGTWADADGDGVPDPADPTPNPTYGGSYNYNGVEYPGPWSDADGDGVPDPADATPNGGYWYGGTEYAGTWADSDGDNVPDPADAWPFDYWNGAPHYTYNGTEYAGEFVDRDGDFIPDPADSWPDDPENGADDDSDGLDNYTERTLTHTLTDDVDSDNDYLTDKEEALDFHTDPNDAYSAGAQTAQGDPAYDFFAVEATTTDTDDDGLPDAVESIYAAVGEPNPDTWLDANGDLDADGYTNLQAFMQGWDLRANLDTYDLDGDGITDVIEDYWNAIRPGVLDKTLFADAVADPDGDGVMNFEEVNDAPWRELQTASGPIVTEFRLDPANGFSLGPGIPDLYSWMWRRVILGGEDPVALLGMNGLRFVPSTVQAWGWASSAYYVTCDGLHYVSSANGVEDGLDHFIAYCSSTALPQRLLSSDCDGDGMSDVFEHRHRGVLSARASGDAGPATGLVSHPLWPKWQDYVDWEALNQYQQDIGGPSAPDPYNPEYATVEEYIDANQWVGVNPFYDPTFGNSQSYTTALDQYYAALKIDADSDGLSNLREFQLNTHPRIADSDGDGFGDGLETTAGSDATDRHADPLAMLPTHLAGVQSLLAAYQSVYQTGSYSQQLAAYQQLLQSIQALQSLLDQINQVQPGSTTATTTQNSLNDVQTDANETPPTTDPGKVWIRTWFNTAENFLSSPDWMTFIPPLSVEYQSWEWHAEIEKPGEGASEEEWAAWRAAMMEAFEQAADGVHGLVLGEVGSVTRDSQSDIVDWEWGTDAEDLYLPYGQLFWLEPTPEYADSDFTGHFHEWHDLCTVKVERAVDWEREFAFIVCRGGGWDPGPIEAVGSIVLHFAPGSLAPTGTIHGEVPADLCRVREDGIIELGKRSTGHADTGRPVFLVPVSVMELSPKVRDEEGNEIPGSEKPSSGKPLSPFVEEDPYTNRIAHRELKVFVGSPLAGKTVTWTLEPLPGATPSNIRGQWEDSPTHQDRFEASMAYGANGFQRISQEQGQTTIGADGHTAVRVNVPPIGFNQVRIKIQIEGTSAPIDLIDMEVPGVVVIDPGHGGDDSGSPSQDNSVLEKDLVLPYGMDLKQQVINKFATEKRGLRVYMTRKTDVRIANNLRAELAKNTGADLFVSIHFNAPDEQTDPDTVRGTLYCNRSSGQVNAAEDDLIGGAVQSATLAAVRASDAGFKARDPIVGGYAVLSDTNYGNTAQYHPIRGTIIEVEFITHPAALETVKLSNTSGVAVKSKFATDTATELFNNILNQP